MDITVERVDRAHMPEPTREALNPWLEEWYNALGAEVPTFVRYHFLFGARTREFPRMRGLAAADLTKVKPETKEGVFLSHRAKASPAHDRPGEIGRTPRSMHSGSTASTAWK